MLQRLMQEASDADKRIVLVFWVFIIGLTAAIFLAIFLACAHASEIDMTAIAIIESSNNPKAVGKHNEIGLYQVTPILLKDYNQITKSHITSQELFNPEINYKVSHWYFTKRIPQLLKHYGLPVTTENIIRAYNSGIKSVVAGRSPQVTRDYLRKYARLAKGE